MMEDKELQAKKDRARALLEGNERSYRELQQATNGQFRMSASDLRREMFIDYLVDAGILTEHQRWDFEIAFNTEVERSLNEYWEKVRASQKPNLTVVKKQSKLIIPGVNDV